ncbi:lantibiotic dehydratase [Streptomyces sp. NPDC050560]|uniref:lantibiotic dehydratase n=1 Tax=Streptomyces sp. NPDC050560 TaxID=3365630 RepID=UPI0037B6F240
MSVHTAASARTAPRPLGDSDWWIWSAAMVRSAGFPARAVDRLADTGLADLADDAGSAAFPAAFKTATGRFSGELAAVARSAGFRLAVGWQNHRFLDTAVEPYLRQVASGRPPNSRLRKRERAIATYWQRYCLKNESIGFFGPTAWATLDPGAHGIAVHPGRGLTDRANVYLERWPVDAMARKLSTDFDLGPWLRPRRSPLLRILDGAVRVPGKDPVAVDDTTLALLRAADGTLTAHDLADRVRGGTGARTRESVFARMADLRERRWLIWRLELPASLAAEEELLDLLEGIGDDGIREAATARARALVEGRERLRRVWDDAPRLRAELTDLAGTFTELTGARPTRHDGQAYGGRTLAYLECRRDVSVRLGAAFTERLAAIVPVLDSVRWLTWRVQEDIRPRIEAAHRTVRERTPPGDPVDVAALWLAAMRTVGPRLSDVVTHALAEFHTRWSHILPHHSDETRLTATTSELEIGVKRFFDAPRSGWEQARTVCPDVMLAADGPDALETGRYRLVLGEIHAAMNSLDYISMAPMQEDPETLLSNLDAVFPGGRLLPLLPTESRPHFTVRSHPALLRPQDQRIALAPHTPPPRTGTVECAADAVVRERDGRLAVVMPDGSEFDVVDLFAEALKSLLLGHFDLFPIAGHRPRITVEDVVLAREGWQVPLSELDFADDPDAAAQFAAARRWARARRLPRRVFVKSPAETKPFYVDFASPLFVDVLCAAARRAARHPAEKPTAYFKITEMLPTPDHLWLTDSSGEFYTSEIRLALSDTRGASAPGTTPTR